jgi:hypothetical protein
MNDPQYKYDPSRKRILAPQERARIYREVEARFAKEYEARGA